MTAKKIGFACKYSFLDAKKGVLGVPELNNRITTVAWLNRQTRDVAEARLWDLMVANIEATRRLVEKIGGLDEHLRMVRLGSDILPVYTEPTWSYFWRGADVVSYCESKFAEVGELSRSRGVRLSFHPGQFCVLASNNADVVKRSLEEFEYHADMVRWMGFGKQFQDFKINVHISGRAGPEGVRQSYQKLSPEARNCITIENEEIVHGISDCLDIADVVPIVLDIHHHWVREGEYIRAQDPRVKRVIDSWRGRRPVCHYSVSREDLLRDHCANTAPDRNHLLLEGYNRQKLRAHSDYLWNHAVNLWALEFLQDFDIMTETKAKNLASFELARLAQKLNLI